MKNLGIPVLILVALVSLWFFMFTLTRPRPKVIDPKAVLKKPAQEAIQKAKEAISKSSFQEAIKLLEPYNEISDPEIQFTIGKAHFHLKNWPQAALAFEKVGNANLSQEFKIFLGKTFEALGSNKKASDILKNLKSAKLNSKQKVEVFFSLARISKNLKDNKTAEEYYRNIIFEDAKQFEPFLEIIKFRRASKNIDGISSILEKANKYHPENFSYQYELGGLFFEVGEKQRARECFEKCLKIKPQDPSPHFYLYEVFLSENNNSQALFHLAEMFDENFSLPQTENQPDLFFKSAILAKKEKRLDYASKFLRGSLLYDKSLMERNDQGVAKAVEDFIRQKGSDEEKEFMTAFFLYLNGDYKSAKEKMQKGMGIIKNARMKGDAEKIIVECERILQLDQAFNRLAARKLGPDHENLKNAKYPTGTTSTVGSQSTGPVQISTTALKILQIKQSAKSKPTDPDTQYQAALRLQQLGENDGAKTLLQEAVKLKPSFAEAHHALALLFQSEGNNANAIQHLEKEIQIDHKNSKVHSLLALLLVGSGEFQAAADTARVALSLDPNNVEARVALAKVYSKINQKEAALAEIEKGLLTENDSTSSNSIALVDLRLQITGER